MEEVLAKIKEETEGLSLSDTLAYLAANFADQVVFSTSFGQEDQVITHLIFSNSIDIQIFTLDTGRLFQETYNVLDSTQARYGQKIKVYYPDTAALEQLLEEQGPNGFYYSVENRKTCCQVRKIAPLERALRGQQVWITGLRAGQSENRSQMDAFEYDSRFGVIKYNPLINWSLDEVEAYLDTHRIPQNALHKQGFVSIGCAPCTRAIEPGEDIRAGRWWWEQSHKECGLHAK